MSQTRNHELSTMKTEFSMIRVLRVLCAASLALPLACGGKSGTEGGEINVSPATLEEATVSIDQIDRLLRVNPQDEHALSALHQLLPKLDELNHLVAQVEPKPGHVVSFYEAEPGVIAISERGPQNGERLLPAAPATDHSMTAIYRSLSGGAEPPAALIEAEQRREAAGPLELQTIQPAPSAVPSSTGENTGTAQQALTADDGSWFAANGCYKNGDSHVCLPNWGGGGAADYYTKTSFFQIAPYSPGVIYVQMTYEGSIFFVAPVFQGDWDSWWVGSSRTWDCCGICACGSSHYDVRHHRWDILQAEGRGFHLSYAAKVSCTLFDCESI